MKKSLSVSLIDQPLRKLASQFDGNEKQFLAAAKRAWKEQRPEKLSKPGPVSFADKCFEAITEGFNAIGMDSDYCPRCYEAIPSGGSGNVYSNHERLPLGRLVQMILERVPAIKLSTARKYARIWERENEPDHLGMTRSGRMALYQQVKDRSDLYKTKK